MWQHIVWIGLLMGAVSLISQAVALSAGWPWQTIVFTVLTLAQLGHVLVIRSSATRCLPWDWRATCPCSPRSY